jgi:hypothetical protein
MIRLDILPLPEPKRCYLFHCGYARWDGKPNDIFKDLLSWHLIYIDKPTWRFGLILHPLRQCPFGWIIGRSVGWYIFEIKLFWIRLLWHYQYFRP